MMGLTITWNSNQIEPLFGDPLGGLNCTTIRSTLCKFNFSGETDPAEGAEGAAGAAEGAEVSFCVDAHAVDPADVAEGEDEHDQEGRSGREALLHTELRRHAQDRAGE